MLYKSTKLIKKKIHIEISCSRRTFFRRYWRLSTYRNFKEITHEKFSFILVWARHFYESLAVFEILISNFDTRANKKSTLLSRHASRGLSWILMLKRGHARYEAVLGVFHHMHLKIRLVSRSVRTKGALMHRLLAALVHHVPPQVLHLVISAVAVIAGETTLATTPSPIFRRLSHVIAHLHVTCRHEE